MMIKSDKKGKLTILDSVFLSHLQPSDRNLCSYLQLKDSVLFEQIQPPIDEIRNSIFDIVARKRLFLFPIDLRQLQNYFAFDYAVHGRRAIAHSGNFRKFAAQA